MYQDLQILNPSNNSEVLLINGYVNGSDSDPNNNPNNIRERDLNDTCRSGKLC